MECDITPRCFFDCFQQVFDDSVRDCWLNPCCVNPGQGAGELANRRAVSRVSQSDYNKRTSLGIELQADVLAMLG